MKLPQIDLAALPNLDVATGIFGSTAQAGGTYDDRVVAVMVYIYEVLPPATLV